MIVWERIFVITVSLLTNVNKDMGLGYMHIPNNGWSTYVPVGINKENYCMKFTSLFLCFIAAW
jgi:hypothetical protein